MNMIRGSSSLMSSRWKRIAIKLIKLIKNLWHMEKGLKMGLLTYKEIVSFLCRKLIMNLKEKLLFLMDFIGNKLIDYFVIFII